MEFIMCVLMFLFAIFIIVGVADIVTYRQYSNEKRKSLEQRISAVEKRLDSTQTGNGRD